MPQTASQTPRRVAQRLADASVHHTGHMHPIPNQQQASVPQTACVPCLTDASCGWLSATSTNRVVTCMSHSVVSGQAGVRKQEDDAL